MFAMKKEILCPWMKRMILLCATFLTVASQCFSFQNSAEKTLVSDVKAQFYELPLYFEKNEGQVDANVQYMTRSPGSTFYFTPHSIVMVLQKDLAQKKTILKMEFIGAKQEVRIKGIDEQGCKSHYFIGSDPTQWQTGISNYAKVEYEGIYPGVNALFYGNKRQLEYDLCLAPHVNPEDIRLNILGAKEISLNLEGDLIILTEEGEAVHMRKPVIYQMIKEKKELIEGNFVLLAKHEIGFQLSNYDPTQSLIIDPILTYSTYLGGNGDDQGISIAADENGNAYITGLTNSTNFPVTADALQKTFGGGVANVFVTKLNAAGTAILYSTYLGGDGDNEGLGIAIDSDRNAYIVGFTTSANFPVTANAFQKTFGGGNTDAFITKLNSTGSALIYSTYLGGSGNERGFGIAVDSSQNAYVTGQTTSTNFPVTAGAFQTQATANRNNGFVTKINAEGTALIYSTYLAGANGDSFGQALALDILGNAYVTGLTSSPNFPITLGAFQTTYGGDPFDAFVTKLNPRGTALVYSTFLGGIGDDEGAGIAVDSFGNAYVTGSTSSPNFPTTVGAFQTTYAGDPSDAFVTKLNPTGTALVYSTYLGGNGQDDGFSIAVDAGGYAYVVGETNSTNFPLTSNAVQSQYGGGNFDVFVAKVDLQGTNLLFSTYLGGSLRDRGFGIALDPLFNAFVTGLTNSLNFPTTAGSYQTTYAGGRNDAFVAKLLIGTPIITQIFPNSGPEKGGTIVTITGANFTTATQVLFGTTPAEFAVDSDTQITALSPPGTGIVDVTVTTQFGTSVITEADQFTYLPLPPAHLRGFQRVNKFATQADYINVLEWKAPFQITPIVSYKIYRDPNLTKLIAVIPNDHKHLSFVQHHRKKGKKYTYFIVSVNELGLVSEPVEVIIGGRGTSSRE